VATLNHATVNHGTRKKVQKQQLIVNLKQNAS